MSNAAIIQIPSMFKVFRLTIMKGDGTATLGLKELTKKK